MWAKLKQSRSPSGCSRAAPWQLQGCYTTIRASFSLLVSCDEVDYLLGRKPIRGFGGGRGAVGEQRLLVHHDKDAMGVQDAGQDESAASGTDDGDGDGYGDSFGTVAEQWFRPTLLVCPD